MDNNPTNSLTQNEGSNGSEKVLYLTKPGRNEQSMEQMVFVRQIKIEEEKSFLDFIKSGTQMHFAVAVDFTASNGPPNDPHSLHYFDPSGNF